MDLLDRAAGALSAAGLTPQRRAGPLPNRSPRGTVPDVLCVLVPGPDALAVVTSMPLQRWPDGTYHTHDDRDRREPVPGWSAALHERPFRTRGHAYEDPAGWLLSPDLDAVVRQVVDWTRWETDWSVAVPVQTPADRLQRLQRLLRSRTTFADVPVVVHVDPLATAMLDRDQYAHARRMLDTLSAEGIRWHFPRDRTHRRLASRTQVLLGECAPPRHPLGKGVWLTATGPAPRTEPSITVGLSLVAPRMAVHRWDGVQEYWRHLDHPRPAEEVWGVGAGPTTSRERVEQTVADLIEGRARAALAAWDVEIGYEAGKLLDGLPTAYEMREWTDKWVQGTAEALAGSAPWLWAGGAAGCKAPHRLVGLGGFNPNRRPGLFLTLVRGRVRLDMEPSATSLVLPRAAWARDPDLDLTLAGLIGIDAVPSTGRRESGRPGDR